jgi:hypothetical protein
MSLTRIHAPDAPTALAEIAHRFGPDALIVSTTHRDGGVDVIVALNADDAPSPRRASPPTTLPELPELPARLLLLGPPGAGVTHLAARLAAHHLRHGDRRAPCLIAPRADMLSPPSPLPALARLLGQDVAQPVGAGHLPEPDPTHAQIIDLSGLGNAARDAAMALGRAADSQCWLVLPTGLHVQAQDALMAPYDGLACALVLTRADLCPPTLEDRALPRRFGLPIAMLATGTSLLDTLCVPDTPFATPTTPDRKDIQHAAARLSR